MSNIMQRQMHEDLVLRTAALKRGFQAIEKIATRKVSEEIFLAYYLDLFTGKSSENRDNLLSYWYAIAGTPYTPVDVINSRGEIVVTVPPILNRNTIPVKSDRPQETDLSYVFDVAQQQASLSPTLANNTVANALTGRFLKEIDSGSVVSLKEQWAVLFAHYAPLKAEPEAQKKQVIESDFEY